MDGSLGNSDLHSILGALHLCSFSGHQILDRSHQRSTHQLKKLTAAMGCSQSSQYYLGFINVSFSHVDVLSFVLGVEITIGTVYLVGCIRDHKKANNQILGHEKAKNYHGWEARNGPDWVSYPMHVVPRTSTSMTPPSDQSPLHHCPQPHTPSSPNFL